ncbi:MAG: hypothetical protein J7L19_02220 [Dehalococcoidia bacterium]|nr:hypothetical protein [Dehalococcoidia bacterium]
MGQRQSEFLRMVWKTTDRICSRQLRPFVGELILALKHHDELTLSPDIEAQFLQMSPSTMDRYTSSCD